MEQYCNTTPECTAVYSLVSQLLRGHRNHCNVRFCFPTTGCGLFTIEGWSLPWQARILHTSPESRPMITKATSYSNRHSRNRPLSPILSSPTADFETDMCSDSCLRAPDRARSDLVSPEGVSACPMVWVWLRKLSFDYFSETVVFPTSLLLMHTHPVHPHFSSSRNLSRWTRNPVERVPLSIPDYYQLDLNLEMISSLYTHQREDRGRVSQANPFPGCGLQANPYSVQQTRWTQPPCVKQRELGDVSSDSLTHASSLFERISSSTRRNV